MMDRHSRCMLSLMQRLDRSTDMNNQATIELQRLPTDLRIPAGRLQRSMAPMKLKISGQIFFDGNKYCWQAVYPSGAWKDGAYERSLGGNRPRRAFL